MVPIRNLLFFQILSLTRLSKAAVQEYQGKIEEIFILIESKPCL